MAHIVHGPALQFIERRKRVAKRNL